MPLVATTQHSNRAIVVAMQKIDQIFSVGSLACTTHSEIPDADYGDYVFERRRLFLSPIEHLVAYPNSQSVEQGERGKQCQIFYLRKIHVINEVDMLEYRISSISTHNLIYYSIE
jgi:hypothetical protein